MSDYNLRLLICSFSIPLLLTIWLSAAALGKQHISAKTTTDWGVRSTTINTKSGKLTVNMPDDAALGDTISGTVVAEPAGDTVEERQANMDTLNGYVFDIPEIPSKVVESEPEETPGKEPESKKTVTWDIPVTVSGEIVDLVIRDPKGNEVTKTDLPVSPPSTYTPPAEPEASDYNLPTIGQAGRPIEVTGPFDGEAVNTDVKIGGKDASILTQSPRKTVVESPKDVIGPTDIELTDGDVTVKGQYRSVALNLSADKLRLKKGEQTRLTVQVMGLQGLQEEIPISLVNKSPTVVSMEGGDNQTVTIRPEEVDSEGIYTINRTLTGIQTGPFSISARISPEYMTVPLPMTVADDRDKDDECECKNMRVELGKKKDTRRFQETLKNGNTKILIKVPYKFKTQCTKGDITAKCKAEIKVGAEWKGDKAPKPISEEVHNGKAKKVTYFTKPAKGAKDENIDCSRDCPKGLSWSEWEPGLFYYEAEFGKLAKELTEKVKITLTPEMCKGRKKSMTYDVSSCECKMISLVFPGVELVAGPLEVTYSLDVNKGRILGQKPGVQLIIPYFYNTTCKGYWRAQCNATVDVDVELTEWMVENVVKQGRGYKVKGEGINSAKIVVNKPEMIACTGKCNRKGEEGEWKQTKGGELIINIDVPVGKIKKKDIDRHTGEFKLTFTPKYCEEVEIRGEAKKGSGVIDSITFKADIKSDKWKDVVGDD